MDEGREGARAAAADDAEVAVWIAALPFTLTAAQHGRSGDPPGPWAARPDVASARRRRRFGEDRRCGARRADRDRLGRSDRADGADRAPCRAALSLARDALRKRRPESRAPHLERHRPARQQILAGLASGELDVIVGTHALVEEHVAFKRLGLAIVDEQHRFGVRQRATFREKGLDPHLLLTTATPIPQTLSQTVYRDLDISVLDELPSGGQQIRTEVRTADALPKVWPWLKERIAQGEQAFIVTPRIEEDAEGDDLPSAEATVPAISSEGPCRAALRLLHGRMPAKERDAVMRRFSGREVDVLVATTVIEVGIDIPNATVMVILGAERFGLAQLHQLRGRVGRRGQKAYAILVSEAAGESERLAAMVEKNAKTGEPLNGFELARRDLEIRGAGEFLGKQQSGESELRIVDLADADQTLIDETAVEADQLLGKDAELQRPEHAALAAAVDDLWRRYAFA